MGLEVVIVPATGARQRQQVVASVVRTSYQRRSPEIALGCISECGALPATSIPHTFRRSQPFKVNARVQQQPETTSVARRQTRPYADPVRC